MWRIPPPNSSPTSTCPPFFAPWKLMTFSQCKTWSSLQSRDYLFYCLWVGWPSFLSPIWTESLEGVLSIKLLSYNRRGLIAWVAYYAGVWVLLSVTLMPVRNASLRLLPTDWSIHLAAKLRTTDEIWAVYLARLRCLPPVNFLINVDLEGRSCSYSNFMDST